MGSLAVNMIGPHTWSLLLTALVFALLLVVALLTPGRRSIQRAAERLVRSLQGRRS